MVGTVTLCSVYTLSDIQVSHMTKISCLNTPTRNLCHYRVKRLLLSREPCFQELVVVVVVDLDQSLRQESGVVSE